MTVSYPSKKIIIGDLPEVRDFRAQFFYNFFVRTEQVDDISRVPDSIKTKSAETFDSTRLDLISRFLPRYVRFDFSPVIDQAEEGRGNEFTSGKDTSNDSSPRRRYNIEKIQGLLRTRGIVGEEELSNSLYTSFNFQDDNIDRKLRNFVSGTVAKRITSYNRTKQQEIDNNVDLLINNLGSEYSLKTAAVAFQQMLSSGEETSDNLIVDAMTHIDNLKLEFIDEEKQRKIEDSTFERVKDVSFKAQFNNKIVGQVFNNIVNDPMSQFSDELKQLRGKANKREISSRESHNSNQISDLDYDTFLDAIDLISGDATDHWSKSNVIGYIIEKSEIIRRGDTPIQHSPIIVPSSEITTAIDINVRYGATYVYTIRTLAELEVKAVDEEGNTTFAISLVSSRPSRRIQVRCEEVVPPPPPADFNVLWDYQQKLPVLTWSFPVNTQQDIKRFQVFRRKTINDAFELIQELDFDDSVIKVPRSESPRSDLVKKVESPVLRFIDTEFTKDSSYIYAVASLDAHDQSSGYSIQFNVSFDRFKNRLVKSLISLSGAPKPYPNFFILTDLFQDTIRDSDHTRMKIYFDAEAIDIEDSDKNKQQLYATTNLSNGKYRMQILNVDLQKQDVLNIKIVDRRESTLGINNKGGYNTMSPSRSRILDANAGKNVFKGFINRKN